MVVFFDIDGTIVDDETQIIPDSTVQAVIRLGENGHIPVVNTGRPFSHIDPRVRSMAFRGWVCGCGMDVRLEGKSLSSRKPDEALCHYIVEQVDACGMAPLYEADDGSVMVKPGADHHPFIAQEKRRMQEKGFGVYTIDQHPTFMKLVVFDSPGCKREAFLSAMEPYFTCIDRGNTMIEVVLKGCSKAGGMEILLNALGVSREEALAIGDSANDLSMFALAGHTVCMGNGMDQVKAVAEYITAPLMEDGIEKALKHYGLI